MPRDSNNPKLRRRGRLAFNFDYTEDTADHELKGDLDLDLTEGDEQVVELLDLACPFCNAVGVTVDVDLAAEDNQEIVAERPWNQKSIKEVAALIVAVMLLILSVPEKTRPIALPGCFLVVLYYFNSKSK